MARSLAFPQELVYPEIQRIAVSKLRMNTEITPQFPATLRRILLIFITLVVSAVMGSALIASWNEPQVANRLELYQTDLLLQATMWDGGDLPAEQVALFRKQLLGDDPLKDAQETYETVRTTAQETLENATENGEVDSPRLQNALEGQAELLDLLDLRLGVLRAEQQDIPTAIEDWDAVKARHSTGDALWRTAATLSVLWQGDPLPANSDQLLANTLNGWFRNRALAKVYDRAQAADQLDQLQQTEREHAERTILILAVVGGLPAIGALSGTIILILVGIQRFIKGSESLLAQNQRKRWETPWTAETIWLVLVVGFFFMGQLVVPLLISFFRTPLASFGIRGQALYALSYYLLMSAGAIAVLWLAIRSYRPLPEGWFRLDLKGNWLLWGLGGYLVALPLMLIVSIANQQLWQGQGGSNPLLQTVLEANDSSALAIFFTTAAIAAPLFEELLFRGFLLPSLTRYLPVWGAIVLSSFIFAAAHLSLSEVLPLMVLGMVLGIVYTRSRNLLAPMLLHSAWNSITMLGLFLLGSSAG
ncbi:MAG: type II CAAX endopeptidase family protein [Cyanobacteria bacterium P01_F01_bin.86]